MTLKFHRWPSKTIGHLFYVFASIMHHLAAISKFTFELQSWNVQIGSNLTIFAPCDLEILQTTLKNNRAPLLYPRKFYASFHRHWSVSIWVTVRKRSNWVKFDDFSLPVTLKFYGWPWKTIGHLFYAHWSFMHHLVAIDEFQFELQSWNGKIGFWPLWPWSLTSDGQTDGRTERRTGSFIELLGCS